MNRFREKSKNIDFKPPKMSHLPHIGHKKFNKKMGSVTFMLSPGNKLENRKELILRKPCYRRTNGRRELISQVHLAELGVL